MTLPADATARKSVPLVSGVLDYFPDALAAVATLSKAGNDQHNPGKPLHWDRAKSGDEADALARHLLQRGTFDNDGIRHSAKVAWRALAMLQKELEAEEGAPLPRGARPGASLHEFLGELAADSQMLAALPPNLRDAVRRPVLAAEADRLTKPEDQL